MATEQPQITVLEQHPIPLDRERADDLQQSNPMFADRDEPLHPAELHARYKDVLAETEEWCVFRSSLYGQSGYVFLWNRQLGYGVRFDDTDDSFRAFVRAMMAAATEVA